MYFEGILSSRIHTATELNAIVCSYVPNQNIVEAGKGAHAFTDINFWILIIFHCLAPHSRTFTYNTCMRVIKKKCVDCRFETKIYQWNFEHYLNIIFLGYITNYNIYLPIFHTLSVFVSNGMTRRRNLKIWRFLNIRHEQKSLLIFINFKLILILLRLSNLSKFFGKIYNFEDILSFLWILISINRECLKYKALKMTLGRSPLLPQNCKILQKFGKNLP